MNDTFMKTRPVFPLLLSMALPNVISMLVNSLYNIVDSLFVAQISEQAMTALSLVFPIQNFVNAVAIGFGIGINAQIALYLGAGDHENANRAATHGMMFSLLHGVLGMVLCIAIMPGFLRRFTTDPALVDMGVTYSTIVFLFSLVNMADLARPAAFRLGCGCYPGYAPSCGAGCRVEDLCGWPPDLCSLFPGKFPQHPEQTGSAHRYHPDIGTEQDDGPGWQHSLRCRFPAIAPHRDPL